MANERSKANAETTPNRIRAAALDVFCSRGYHAASMRDIAASAEVQPASLYHHFSSKEALLEDLMTSAMEDLRDDVIEAIAIGTGPEDRLARAIRAHVIFNGTHRQEAIVADTELRGLSGSRLDRVIGLRRVYESLIRQLIVDGTVEGVFQTSDASIATKALLIQSTGVALWYHDGGPQPLDEIADVHVQMALKMLAPETELATGEAVRTLAAKS
jgi:AcrR family transcriptional regulator